MSVAQTASRGEVQATSGAGEVIKAGLVAGIIGGMLMAMIMMAATAAAGMGLLAPLRLIAATLEGKNALTGAGPLAVGLVIHMMSSMIFGVVFAAIAGRRLPVPQAVMAGVAFGVVLWGLMTFGGLPLVNPMMRDRVATMPVAWLLAHVAFGMGVGSAPGLRRRFAA